MRACFKSSLLMTIRRDTRDIGSAGLETSTVNFLPENAAIMSVHLWGCIRILNSCDIARGNTDILIEKTWVMKPIELLMALIVEVKVVIGVAC